MSIISIPKALWNKIGDEASEALITMLEKYSEENKQSVLDSAEQRFEIKLVKETALIRNEMSDLKIHIENKVTHEVETLRSDLIRVDQSLRTDIARYQANTIKWMFIFWIGQIGALVGILFAFFS